ncbi:PIG-L family deacetylase, partial [bacterium]
MHFVKGVWFYPLGNTNTKLRPGVAIQKRFLRLPLWQRFLVGALLLPPLLAGGTAGAYYLQLHQQASNETISNLPLFPTPQKNHRYLVLAPHCDDETLAVGGFIAEATRQGASVSVALMTNGDGFPAAATRELKEVNLSPADYVRFAERRQAEAKRAEQALGVDAKNVYFLGYPDRGLRPMWETNWDDIPYRSSYTAHTHSPYPVTYTPHTTYCGVNLQNDLVRLMEEVRPTDVFVTHPADDHPDHSAAASFAQSAFRICTEERKDVWAQTAKMHYYIVH